MKDVRPADKGAGPEYILLAPTGGICTGANADAGAKADVEANADAGADADALANAGAGTDADAGANVDALANADAGTVLMH